MQPVQFAPIIRYMERANLINAINVLPALAGLVLLLAATLIRRPPAQPRTRLRPVRVIAAANRAARAITPRVTSRARYAQPLQRETASRATATMAELLGEATGEPWSDFVADSISSWAVRTLDADAAVRPSPWRGQAPYAAWRGEAELDRTPEIIGVPGFRGIARTLPRDADALLARVADEFRLSGELFDIYLERLLASVAGWAGHACAFDATGKRSDARVRELLAIRAAWDLALVDAFDKRRPELLYRLRSALENALAAARHPGDQSRARTAAGLVSGREACTGARARG